MSSNQDQCDHCGKNCNHTAKFGCEQTLDEIEFEKSIFYACVQGDFEKVKSFISKRGNQFVNEQDKNGYTCLHYAARNGHVKICQFLLISCRANSNLKTFSCKSTPLHRAAYMGNHEIVQLLLNNHSSPYEKDCDGKTALHKCVEQLSIQTMNNEKSSKFLETIKILIKFDPNLVYAKDNNQRSSFDIYPDSINFVK
jgi:ankyrin repeat protein